MSQNKISLFKVSFLRHVVTVAESSQPLFLAFEYIYTKAWALLSLFHPLQPLWFSCLSHPIMTSEDAQPSPHLPPSFVYSSSWSSPAEVPRDLQSDHINIYKPTRLWELDNLLVPHRATLHL